VDLLRIFNSFFGREEAPLKVRARVDLGVRAAAITGDCQPGNRRAAGLGAGHASSRTETAESAPAPPMPGRQEPEQAYR